MNSTEDYGNLTTTTEVFDYYDGYDFTSAYTGAILNIIIIPVQVIVAKIIWYHNELWSNASYCLLIRLIIVEFVQSLATVISGIFPLAPRFWHMDFPRKSCAVALSAGFLLLFPLMSELSVFRILIIMKRAQPSKLPRLLLIFEVICYVLTAALGVGIYHNESIHFYYGDWDFKHDIFSAILNTAELYFCYPMLILTYCSYLFLIGLIYGIRKGSRTPAKEEWILFGVSTFTTVYFCSLIGYFQLFWWYSGPESPVGSFFFQVWIQFISGTNYYWTALILLLFNKTIRSKLRFRQRNETELLSNTSNFIISRRRL